MSVLETPRILFSGQVAWDPIVTNNVDAFYDEVASEPVFPAAKDKVAKFRAEAIAAVAPNKGGLWNPQGTHRSTFFETAISGADLGNGVVQNDPFVGSPARFLGMLVDLEPYGTFTSQLFFDTMTFGIDGGYRIAAPRSARFTGRYINFGRNPVGYRAGIASVVWQTSFAKADGLAIDAFDSPALQALQRALEDDDVLGLTVQWNAYRTIYYNAPEIAIDETALPGLSAQLIAKLTGGGFQPNPARSMLVGVIGLWRRGESVHEPCDRTLIGPTGNSVATAHARVAGDSITLDLSNSISETGLNLVKQDLGDLTVGAIDPKSGKPVPLATFGYRDYDTAAYLRSSGIITLRVDPDLAAMAASGDLVLQDSQNSVLLTESALRVLPLVPNLYMDQGHSVPARFQVYDRGVAAGAGIEVTVYVVSSDGNTVESSFTLTTDSGGIVTFPLRSGQAGIAAYVTVPGPDPAAPVNGIDPQVNTFMYVRVLPADNATALLSPTWDNVYSNVLANWKAMAPCMDNWLDLENEAQVRSFGALIKKLTNEASFESYRFMPVTRDMTAGQRTLLYAFLDAAPAVAAKTLEAAAAPAPTGVPNRRMRSDRR